MKEGKLMAAFVDHEILRMADEGIYRKLVREGGSRTLAIGTIVPHDWHAVRVIPIAEDKTHIAMILVKLY